VNDDLGPLPQLHPRFDIVEKAKHELMSAWLRVIENHELTRGEQLKVVTETAQSWAENIARQLIRWERHGDTEKPGDEA
jgi:hypothetical protein